MLGKIGGEMRRLMADPGYIDIVLRSGAERANAIAGPVLREARTSAGCCDPDSMLGSPFALPRGGGDEGRSHADRFVLFREEAGM